MAIFVTLVSGVGVMAANHSTVGSLATFAGSNPDLVDGIYVLSKAAATTALKVCLALAASAGAVTALLSASVLRPRLQKTLRHLFRALANAPILLLLPLWLTVFGNGQVAGMSFLVFSFMSFLGFVVFADEAGGAEHAAIVVGSFALRGRRKFELVWEAVIQTMSASLFDILILALPLALAAELLTRDAGLGHLALSAYENGDFHQLLVIAAAYTITFCALWSIWETISNLPSASVRRAAHDRIG
jgi:ABC-type nitrate/sulfonate/bicarbonate transport system permease component